MFKRSHFAAFCVRLHVVSEKSGYTMINQDKIKLMVDVSAYEDGEGRLNSITNSYFKSDYVGKHMLANFVSYTFCFVILLFIAVMYRFEDISETPDILESVMMFKPYVKYYIVGLLIIELITIPVYIARHDRAQRLTKVETAKLKKIGKMSL